MVVDGKNMLIYNLDVSLIYDFLDSLMTESMIVAALVRPRRVDDYLSGDLEVFEHCGVNHTDRIKNEIKGMVKLILPRIKVNASVRIIFPCTFVADGVKRLRMNVKQESINLLYLVYLVDRTTLKVSTFYSLPEHVREKTRGGAHTGVDPRHSDKSSRTTTDTKGWRDIELT